MAPCPDAVPCTSPLVPGQPLRFPALTVLLAPGSNAVTVSYDGKVLTVSGPPSGLQVDAPAAAQCHGVNGLSDRLRCQTPQGQIRLMVAPPNPGTGTCPTTTLPAGWNVVSGRLAAVITTNVGPVYSYSAQSGAYTSPATSSDIAVTGGYWVLYDEPARVALGCGPPIEGVQESDRTVTIAVASGWTMVGNGLPLPAASEVTAADITEIYDPPTGYRSGTRLAAGQGAWVYAATGGVVLLTTVDYGQ